MLRRTFMFLAIAMATLGIVVFGGSNRAEAAIELTVSDGVPADTLVFYFASSNGPDATLPFSIGGYNMQVQTTTTNYAGTPVIGSISTTVNILSVLAPTASLTTRVDVIAPVAGVLDGLVILPGQIAAVEGSAHLLWTAPASALVKVSADLGVSTNASITSGTGQTTSFYDSPGVAGDPGTPVVMSLVQNFPPATQIAAFQQVTAADTGTYTLSQEVTVSGINSGAAAVNYTANSGVTPAVPEPSTMAIAGIGALGMIGFGLRRRKARGA